MEFICRNSNLIVHLFLQYFLLDSTSSSSILFYFGNSHLSHRLAVWPLVTELANRGHNITFLSPHSNKAGACDPRVQEINIYPVLSSLYNTLQSEADPLHLRLTSSKSPQTSTQVFWDFAALNSILICEEILQDKTIIQKWLRSSTKYDLVIIDSLNNDCGLGISYILGAKFAIFSPSNLFMSAPDDYGFPAETSWIPDLQWNFQQQEGLNFFQRFVNTLRTVRWHLLKQAYLFHQLESLFRKYLVDIKPITSSSIPGMREIEKNVSLVLLNSHFSEEYARSLPPFVVPVGGLHILDKHKELPNEILKFINEEPFFYISFGSSFSMPSVPEFTKTFVDALVKSGYKFVIKSDTKFVQTLLPTDQFYLAEWLPQQDILAHAKIRGFISTGGSLSVQESIYYSVSLILLPVLMDADYNAERVERLGIGIKLEMSQLTQEILRNALEQVQHNSTIRNNIRKVSRAFKDRPMKPLALAAWWVEFVLRDENPSLKPLSINQSWFQRRALDVWFLMYAIIIFISIGSLFILYFVTVSIIHSVKEFFYIE